MPPANSPDPAQSPSFISALRELESPVNQDVLNLAATLGTSTDDDDGESESESEHGDEHHLLRLHAAREHTQLRLDRSRERLRLLEQHRDETDQRDRLRRVMSRLSRLSDSAHANSNPNPSSNPSRTAYGDRVPSQNSLYDWSPSNNEADDEDELDQILAELRREQPNTHPEILRVLGRSQLDSERERIRAISARLQHTSAESSLRSTAILQSVRRHPRFSARARDSTTRPPQQRLSEGRAALARERRDMLEQTVRYLARIRHADSIHDSMNCALDAGFLSKDAFSIQYADFITNTFSIPPPAETSWLAPGAVLSGCQHATSVAASLSAPGSGPSINRFRILENAASMPALTPPTRPWIANSYSSTRNQASGRLPEVTPHGPPQDRWPVKVTIHSVDWEKMALSATMEAYNVPSHPHALQPFLGSSDGTLAQHFTRTSSITTYLEGEILDFNTHTLLTESFKSNAANDATYWRKLPPFQHMSDEEVVRALVSKKWFTEVLGRDWILMRWKERCFVKSLNRSTADPVQPPLSTTTPITDGPSHDSFQSSSSLENHYYPAPHASQLQPSPYRIVRNQQTGRAEVEVAPLFPPASTMEGEHATFDDSGCGLTISGFYYVCLRRSDGKLEGLYYDPQSSPYQCLKMESVRGGVFPAWGFR